MLLPALIGLVLGAVSVLSASISVDVTADWPRPPEESIIVETLSRHNESAVFQLLTLYAQRVDEGVTSNHADFLFEKALEFVNDKELFEADIAMGSAIPSIIARSYQKTDLPEYKCSQLGSVNGITTCDLTELYAPRKSRRKEVVDAAEPSFGWGPTTVFYADLTDAEAFSSWHTALMSNAMEGKLTYVLRYKLPQTAENTVNVAGYGLQVQLKRTDYLVVDDRSTDGELNLDLNAPTGKLTSSEVPHLGRKLAQHLAEDGTFDTAVETILNIPGHLSEINTESIDDEEFNQKFTMPAGVNVISVDGKIFENANVFDFIDALRQESAAISTLAKEFMVSKKEARDILQSYLAEKQPSALRNASSTMERFNVESDAIVWLTDVEKDQPFEDWPQNLGAILTSDPGYWPSVRRNINSLVLALDIDDPRHLRHLGRTLQMLFSSAQITPLQVGIVPLNTRSPSVAKLLDQSARGRSAVQAYLLTLLKSNDYEEADIVASKAPEDPDAVRSSDPTEFVKTFDLTEPTIFANGYALSPSDWQMSAMRLFDEDLALIQNLLETEQLDTEDVSTNLRRYLLSKGAASRNEALSPLSHQLKYDYYPQGARGAIWNNKNGITKGEVVFVSNFSTPQNFETAATILDLVSAGKLASMVIYATPGTPQDLAVALYGDTPMTSSCSGGAKWLREAANYYFNGANSPKLFRKLTSMDRERAMQRLAEQTPEKLEEKILLDGRIMKANDTQWFPEIAEKHVLLREHGLKSAREQSALKAAAANRAPFQRVSQNPPHVSVKASEDKATIMAIIDPVSEKGQELIALLDFARKLGHSTDVYFAPSESDTVPNRFFSVNFPVHRTSGHTGSEVSNLNSDTLYTIGIVEPPSWVVTGRECEYDLDNIILNTVKNDSDLKASYTLKSILIEGQNSEPRVQLTLKDGLTANRIGDTMVMENLGYFQLQAPKPGPYYICSEADCITTSVSSMNPAPLVTRLEVGEPISMFQRLVRFASTGKDHRPKLEETAQVNVFTVASGHLYERFASLMMISVMKHAKHRPVKFWLIENFMSPSFKQFLPYLAEKKGFEYELVSFKWPFWLRQQTEKQREIWGYKILFLDVLFPQHLHKVIFVDSDQIVRTDLKELMDEDLQGAPYGYAPMGDDRPEMEPFRFWKQGYWKKLLGDDYLYHISALYVIDLDRFRELSAGDRLREHYQQLSADPESLSNLDQDLPNNLQMRLPIHTLDRDWLWCETWCSDESLKTAKTIDLCNNPLTKEPKLDRARRQIPEWNDYDEEVATLRNEFLAAKRSWQLHHSESLGHADLQVEGSHEDL